MRVIHESDKPIGARAIADELNNRGYDIERAGPLPPQDPG